MRYDDLRRQLAALVERRTPANENLRLLARALTDQTDPALDCKTCRGLIPELVHAESMGEDVKRQYADVRTHLLLCAECEQIYIEQLDLAWRLAQDEIPQAHSRPVPDLGFLKQRRGSPAPAPLSPQPDAWWTKLRPVISGLETVLLSFVPQGTFQPAHALEDQAFEVDRERGLERRRLAEIFIPHISEGVLTAVATRQGGADTCDLLIRIDSPHREPGNKLVHLLYGGGIRQDHTDHLGRVRFPQVPVAALPDIQIEIPDVGD